MVREWSSIRSGDCAGSARASPLNFATAYARNPIVEAKVVPHFVPDFVGGLSRTMDYPRAQVYRGSEGATIQFGSAPFSAIRRL